MRVCTYIGLDVLCLPADVLCNGRDGAAKRVSEILVWGWSGHSFPLQQRLEAHEVLRTCCSLAAHIPSCLELYLTEMGEFPLKNRGGKKDCPRFDKWLPFYETALGMRSLTMSRPSIKTSSFITSLSYLSNHIVLQHSSRSRYTLTKEWVHLIWYH